MAHTIAEIETALRNESARHRVDHENVFVDKLPLVQSVHNEGFHHTFKCICGDTFNLVSQHSAKTPQGQIEIQMALTHEYARHFESAIAMMIYGLYDTVQ